MVMTQLFVGRKIDEGLREKYERHIPVEKASIESLKIQAYTGTRYLR